MKHLLLVLAIVGFVFMPVAQAAVVAQELTGDDYVEYWKPLIGSWKTSIGFGKLGIGGATQQHRLAGHGKCLLTYFEVGEQPSSQTIEGYDPGTKKWTKLCFTSDGNCSWTTIEFIGMKKGAHLDKAVVGKCESRGSVEDGKVRTVTSTMACTECTENRAVLTFADYQVDGLRLPDMKMVLERQSDQQQRLQSRSKGSMGNTQGVTASDYIAFWKPLLGSWEIVNEDGGKEGEISWTLWLSRNNECLLAYAESEGQLLSQTIDGYDPGTKKWTSVGFDADGTYSLTTTEFADMKKRKYLGKGIIGKFEVKKSSNDGKVTMSTSTMSCTECAENRIVFTWSDGKADGQPVPDGTIVLERQPERERRARQ